MSRQGRFVCSTLNDDGTSEITFEDLETKELFTVTGVYCISIDYEGQQSLSFSNEPLQFNVSFNYGDNENGHRSS